jgi:hypothetical protein
MVLVCPMIYVPCFKYLDLMVCYQTKLVFLQHCIQFDESGYFAASINYRVKD